MAKKSRQKQNQNKQRNQGKQAPANHRQQAGDDTTNELLHFLADAKTKKTKKPLEAMTQAQGHYIIDIESKPVTFGLGPAGTGKTYVATAMACDALLNQEIDTLYVTRPIFDEEDIGFLPGDENDKFAPYFTPVREVIEERLGTGFTEYLIKVGRIKIAPFAFMRGRTFKNAFVILDEAQNTTPKQMKTFLTRIGQNSTVVINGDSSQQDIPGDTNGLDDAYSRFKTSPYFGSVVFENADVRRSELVQHIVEQYDDAA